MGQPDKRRRVEVPKGVATALLELSLRRCCVCFGLQTGSLDGVVDGQIAHLDRNPSNNALDNLAWMCQPHHDRYDSRPSQTRGFSKEEVKSYRERLYLRNRTDSPQRRGLLLANRLDPTGVLAERLSAGLVPVASQPLVSEYLSRLDSLVNENPDVLEAVASNQMIVSGGECAWFGGAWTPVRDVLQRAISECGLGRLSRLPHQTFEDEINPLIAERHRVVYLFPFFLTPSRRRLFGVIQYAKQFAGSIIIHKKHPAYADWRARRTRPRVLQTGSSHVLPVAEARRWIDTAVEQAATRGGSVVWCAGESFFEILGLVLNTHGSESAQTALAHAQRGIIANELPDILRGHSTPGSPESFKVRAKDSIFIVDPASSFDRSLLSELQFDEILWAHGIDIPVGLGFSMPVLLSLLQNDRWQDIARTSAAAVAKLREPLQRVGIAVLDRTS